VSARVIRADLLIGRKVRDAEGRVVGRIEELCAEVAGVGASDYVVTGLRLRTAGRVTSLLRRASGRTPPTRTLSWREFDLSDPASPRLVSPRTSG
jgi:hypothetical protein